VPVAVRTSHTSATGDATLAAARALLFDVFTGDDAMTEEDWEHCLGGIHALAYDGDELVGHAAVVMRRLILRGEALRCGYVEGVAVATTHQRRGIGGALMDELDPVLRGGYAIGALGATEAAVPLYTSRGWQPWRGRLSRLTPDGGIVPTPDEEGWVYVLEIDRPLDRGGELTVDHRPGDAW
jgi:aminoglycoside 2'-N-acetyltransferase I